VTGGGRQLDVIGARPGPAGHTEPVGRHGIGRRREERGAQRHTRTGLDRLVAKSVPDDLGEQRGLVEGIEVGEVHPAGPGSPHPGVIGHPPKVQRDGQPVAEQAIQLPTEQLVRRSVVQASPLPGAVVAEAAITASRTKFLRAEAFRVMGACPGAGISVVELGGS